MARFEQNHLYLHTILALRIVYLCFLLNSTNEECVLEASRVYGNLSQIQQVRHFMVDNSMDKLFITLLDSANRELVFTSGETFPV